MTFSFAQLQAEQAPWVEHNFGDRPSWMPLLGIARTGKKDPAKLVEDLKKVRWCLDRAISAAERAR